MEQTIASRKHSAEESRWRRTPNIHLDGGVVRFTYKNADDQIIHTPGSNFWEDETGHCVEIEFQADKHEGHPIRQAMIRRSGNPWKAKKLGRKWRLTGTELKRWDRDKTKVMHELVGQKLDRSAEFREWLIATASYKLIEYNWWHDQEWGSCTCPKHFYLSGKNILGKILMGYRDELVRQVSN